MHILFSTSSLEMKRKIIDRNGSSPKSRRIKKTPEKPLSKIPPEIIKKIVEELAIEERLNLRGTSTQMRDVVDYVHKWEYKRAVPKLRHYLPINVITDEEVFPPIINTLVNLSLKNCSRSERESLDSALLKFYEDSRKHFTSFDWILVYTLTFLNLMKRLCCGRYHVFQICGKLQVRFTVKNFYFRILWSRTKDKRFFFEEHGCKFLTMLNQMLRHEAEIDDHLGPRFFTFVPIDFGSCLIGSYFKRSTQSSAGFACTMSFDIDDNRMKESLIRFLIEEKFDLETSQSFSAKIRFFSKELVKLFL